VFGLLPLIISLDPLFFSMAVILAFGLIFGTILTLGVVPALYAVLFRVKAG
jgi:multidrug efflux pump subunit AcrB